MTGLAFPPRHLESYLAHIVDGRTLGDLARVDGGHRSTYMRRINRVEKLSDHPEWDALLTALRAARLRRDYPTTADGEVTRETVAQALSLTCHQIRRDFYMPARRLSNRDAYLIIGEMPKAAVVLDNAPTISVGRELVLAALAFGWITPFGAPGLKVRRFKATQDIAEVWDTALDAALGTGTISNEAAPEHPATAYSYSNRVTPLEQLFRRKDQTYVTPEHLQLDRQFHEIYLMRESGGGPEFQRLIQGIHPRVLEVLVEICGKRKGLEETEKRLGWPARSAKLAVIHALDTFAFTWRAA